MRPSKQTWGRTHEKERWRYEWKAREMVVVTQGLSRMKGSREVRRRKEQTKGGRRGKGEEEVQKGRLKTCEEVEGVF
jgi:hypothetical protein